MAIKPDEVVPETTSAADAHVIDAEGLVEGLCKVARMGGNEAPKACEIAWMRSCCEKKKESEVVTGLTE